MEGSGGLGRGVEGCGRYKLFSLVPCLVIAATKISLCVVICLIVRKLHRDVRRDVFAFLTMSKGRLLIVTHKDSKTLLKSLVGTHPVPVKLKYWVASRSTN